ncbi:hypothetical protein [Bowmanella dokdonensis]|uniref:Uncharacterized protein n=1 Tax=Bowmanella dokdonensis TaxID=751969 RepID=A0A939IQM9_9ALTE|nr:hypothetical protein [Bowmanella dokdonensis]MBN7824747.1 hypothetical protein [Bowmanella dokdonensis]
MPLNQTKLAVKALMDQLMTLDAPFSLQREGTQLLVKIRVKNDESNGTASDKELVLDLSEPGAISLTGHESLNPLVAAFCRSFQGYLRASRLAAELTSDSCNCPKCTAKREAATAATTH